MALYFPETPANRTTVDGVEISRTWQYTASKNRWELVDFDRLSFDAEQPIINYERNGDIVYDLDIQDLDPIG